MVTTSKFDRKSKKGRPRCKNFDGLSVWHIRDKSTQLIHDAAVHVMANHDGLHYLHGARC